MNILPTRYALLRDRRDWETTAMAALTADDDGVLALLPIPCPAAPVALAPPYVVLPSGIACAPCASRFVADTAHNQIVYVDGACATEVRLPPTTAGGAGLGEFSAPRGLAFRAGDGLYVADSGNARVVKLQDPTLEVVAVYTAGLVEPRTLALDSKGALIVVDGAAGSLHRFAPSGAPDVAFDTAWASHGIATSFIAIAGDDTLCIATTAGALLRFAAGGAPLPSWPALDPAVAAGALAIDGDRLYVADTATGTVLLLDRNTGATLAGIPGFRGPVTALAVCTSGDLLVKPGFDATFVYCLPAGAVAAAGVLESGPLDAGERDAWYQVSIDADVPAQASVSVALYASDTAAPGPGPADWIQVPAPAALVGNLIPAPSRYLWLRVTLASVDRRATPRLLQVRAETPGEDYLDDLPAIYRKSDLPGGLLRRMLALLRAQFDASDRIIDALPLRIAIDFAPAADLPWLAGWLGFELPPGTTTAEWRALLHRVVALYDRRGTPLGLAELVFVYTGVRPRIVEAFRDRRIWQLGVTSALGFDTALSPLDPAGMMVPDLAHLADTRPPYDCAVPERLTVGAAIVGAGGPLAAEGFGAPLFDATAHLFRVYVPAYQAPNAALHDAIRNVIDAEKPAHTDYELCFIEATMRVGMQAQIGIDTIVANEPAAAPLSGVTLGTDSYLGSTGTAGRVGAQARLGRTTVLA